jgi:hypothetical protein
MALKDRLRASAASSIDGEIVLYGNLFSAVAAGVVSLLWLKPAVALAVFALALVALTACLLHRLTFWIAALAGGLWLSAIPALVGWFYGDRFGRAGSFIGGGLGLAIGMGVALYAYRNVSHSVRSS